MLKLYFSGPLFSSAEKKFNIDLAQKLEKRGISVFLPQRDGPENDPNQFANLTEPERREAIFVIDRMKILECDIFLFILDGRVPDEGSSVELGMAYAQKYIKQTSKFILGLHTDSRAAFIGLRVNPMLQQSLDKIFKCEEDLMTYIDTISALPAIHDRVEC